jgi:hypothetical protein
MCIYSIIMTIERKGNIEFAWPPCCFMFYKTCFNQRASFACIWKVRGSCLGWDSDYSDGRAVSSGLPEKISPICLAATQT